MTTPSLASPDDQGATFVELFFDLVFVFAITQVTHHAAHHLTPQGIGGTVVVFWLVWWAWTQFTWALNAANTDVHAVRAGTLVATGIAFVMAASVDHALGAGALWFALPYVAVRLLGLLLYHRVAAHDAELRRGVEVFALASLAGLAAVLAGAFVAPEVRTWVWLGAILLDVGAAAVAGRHHAWHLHAEHFAERHGLIVIIALGESLIVAGSAVAAEQRGTPLIVAGGLAVTATCLLWWTYFGWIKDAMEERLVEATGEAEVRLARDAYSLWHFPLVCGIIAYAVGLIGILARPAEAVPLHTSLSLGIGVALFVGSTAGALQRATGRVLWPRLVLVAVAPLAGFACAVATPVFILGTVCVALVLVVVIEHRAAVSPEEESS